MIHWLQPSKSADIAKYVDCYWLIEKTANATSYQYPKLNPDPSAHLIISPSNQPYHYDLGPGSATGIGCHWLFPHKQTFQLDHSKPFVHLGVKFHIGALYSLGRFAGKETTLDGVEEINLSKEFSHLNVDENRLIELARHDPHQCGKQLDNLLSPWIANASEDQYSKITKKALQLLDTSTISELGAQLFCSQRTLERSFQRVTGLTLKQCQSMNKLEALLEYLTQRGSEDIDWVAVAYEFGFSDQPHLIRHLKKQLGLTPKTYEKERGLTIDVYGMSSSSS
ncbi:helix-turn-helix domain-containing protein [Vibrio sp. 99-8-1]|uniref:helix-turn-helix domain-containing protein n=1 Tax=Vibrio sp. 99-8-1 TaxID=2607602 RepID=UPI00149338C2|nr:helix-turn-helix domain-containing protein [Vibrio sp. 99-8-1]NOI65176.1 AraC family transcriptional regulator [Vibrio sp. 99-8-1]